MHGVLRFPVVKVQLHGYNLNIILGPLFITSIQLFVYAS